MVHISSSFTLEDDWVRETSSHSLTYLTLPLTDGPTGCGQQKLIIGDHQIRKDWLGKQGFTSSMGIPDIYRQLEAYEPLNGRIDQLASSVLDMNMR